jgi:hypothetical protein
MRSRIGKVSKGQLVLLALVAVTVASGMLVGGNVGYWMQIAGWGVLAVAIILKVGIVNSSSTDGRSPRHF